MPSRTYTKTAYPGVFYCLNKAGQRVYYIRYEKGGGRAGKDVFEKVQGAGVTPKIAARIREEKIAGYRLTNAEKRQEVAAENLSFKELYRMYIKTLPENRARKADEINFNHLSKIHSKSIDEITTKDVDAIRYEKATTHSPQTVKLILNILTRTINFGVKKGIIVQPDSRKLHVDKPKVDNQKTEFMTDEQLMAYIAALDKEEDQDTAAFLRIALLTGMRRGAILGLKWGDIDFKNGIVTLQPEYAKNNRTSHIAVNEDVLKILQKLPRSGEFIFPGKEGGKRENFKRMAVRVRDAAGLPPDFRPLHGLRHNFASRLASSGQVDLYTLQKLLTHESPEMTQRYAHLADAAMKRAANVITEAMTPSVNNDQKSILKGKINNDQ